MRSIAPLDGPTAPAPFNRIEAGDMVTVVTKAGRRDTFEVGAIDGDTLESNRGARYPRAEMVQLHHEQIDPRKVLAIVAGSIAGTIVLIAALAASGFGGR